jgi:hypothetical protein
MSIFELIEAGDARGARKLLADDPSLASARDDQGLSALMRASYRGGGVYAAVREAEPELDAWDRIVVGEAATSPLRMRGALTASRLSTSQRSRRTQRLLRRSWMPGPT